MNFIPDMLYIASESRSRHQLLMTAKIPFKTISHNSDEKVVRQGRSFQDYVLAIACDKMASVVLPSYNAGSSDFLYVLTADTLIRVIQTDEILGKPANREDARRMLCAMNSSVVEIVTGCCVQKYRYEAGTWAFADSRLIVTTTQAEFFVSDDQIDRYLQEIPFALSCAGAGVIEDFGSSFLKSVNGSYSGALGLPLYELRQAIGSLGFIY